MQAAAHRIETLSWELSFRDSRLAAEQQDELARFLRKRVLARLEAGFDRHVPARQVWQLDRLELDLGRLRLRDGPEQWERQLDAALDQALQHALGSQGQAVATGRRSARRHEIALFLHYLQHGHLPWGAPLHSGRDMAGWLERLARQHGLRLWDALQQLMPPEPALARLAQISPHQGLQALLAERHPEMAEAMELLDEVWLAPLQRRGRLSAYQVQRLQQALRAAGLRSLWGYGGGPLSAARQRRLVAQLLDAHADLLGSGWLSLRQQLAGEAQGRKPGSELARSLLEALLGSRARAGAQAGADRPDAALTPTRTWQAALALLREGLRSDKASPAQRARLARLIAGLAASHPAALRQHLQRWVLERRSRRQWSELLEPGTLWSVLQLLAAPAQALRPDSFIQRMAAPHWADSLRQTALRMLASCPAAQRPGLSQLQALLLEASLQHVAAGRRLPDSHSAWQALWARAWAGWLGNAAEPQALPAPPRPAAAPDVDQELQQLRQDCEHSRWGLAQRLRLARLLETPSACRRWLQLVDEPSRWRMLRAQFGQAIEALKQRASRLWRHFAAARSAPAEVAERSGWWALCRQLFLRGLGPDPALLRREQALIERRLRSTAAAPTPRAEALPAAPIWVGDAGQVLLAAYAERLFEQLGLARQGRFVDRGAQARAVLCLQALAHGREATAEPEWVLSKLLCGVLPGELLPACEPLDEASHALIEGLLGAVIAHWKAIGHTSVAGLRESFLRREGRLTANKPAEASTPWRLQVQPRAFDMLLDRLPWGFTTLKLPWMTGVLHVDWR